MAGTIPSTGLTMLGEALSGGARDYTNRRRQLEDVQSARDYQDRNYGRARQDQLADIDSARAYDKESLANRLNLQAQQDITLGLVHEGILAPGDMNKPEAVAAAYEVARARGLDKLYSDLLTAPGPDGKPLLDRTQLNNPQAIEAAKAAYAQIQSTVKKSQLEQPANAAASIDALAAEGQRVRQQMNLVEQKLSETAPTIDHQTVLNRAVVLAKDAKDGKTPSQQEIQAMVGQATQEAQQIALQRWYQEKEDAKIQYQLLNGQLNNIRQQQTELTRTFQVAPRASALAEPVGVSQAAPPPEASAAQRQAAFADALKNAGVTPASAAPIGQTPANAPLPNMVNDPIIQQENTRRQGAQLTAQNSMLADPYNEAMDRLQAVNGRIAQVRNGGAPNLIPTPGAGMLTAPLAPSQQAEQLSNLLIQQQVAERDLEAKRRTMLGITAGVTAPTVSDASGSAPAAYSRPANWWNTGE